jgi:EmrB/QacA subfamily drug resistance transporter
MTAVTLPQQTFSSREKHITMAGILLVFWLSALDQTIVATAMPRIAVELKGFDLYAWVTTAYMLASTVMVPIWGKLNDLFGRKPALITSVLLFMAGSILCGTSGAFGSLLGGGMMQLIVFRSVQGVGAAGLFTSAYTVIGDLYSPRERGKVAGWLGAVFALASIIGPVIGGLLSGLGEMRIGFVVVIGWRCIFYVNVPIACFALFMTVAKMPQMAQRVAGRLDWAGALLIIATVAPFLLVLSWGGEVYRWLSLPVIGLLLFSAGCLGGLIWVEATVDNPILSLGLFRNRVFSTVNSAGLVIAMPFMGSVAFLPLYIQLGQGVPATTSGISMLAMMVGMLSSSAICGQIVSHTGHYKSLIVAGSAMLVLAFFVVSRVGPHTTTADLCWRVLLIGIGMGPSISTFNLVVQNALPRQQIGVATASTQFFRQIGSTVGVAIFGTVLANHFSNGLAQRPASNPPARMLRLSDLALRLRTESAQRGALRLGKPPQVEGGVRELVSRAFNGVFKIGFTLSILALGLVVLIPALPLEGSERRTGRDHDRDDRRS